MLRDVLDGEGYSVVVCRSLLEVHQAAVRGAGLAIVDSWGPGCLTLSPPEREQSVGAESAIRSPDDFDASLTFNHLGVWQWAPVTARGGTGVCACSLALAAS